LNINQLRAFVAVVDTGSFSAAARSLGLSQPAVTMQIQGLEGDLGVTLIDRRYRSSEPTEAGRALLPHARAVLAQLTEAREALDAAAGQVSGELALAASTTPGQYVLPRLIGTFLEEHPQVGVRVAVADTADVVVAVATGAAALGVTGARIDDAHVTFEAVGTDELVIVAPPGSPLAGRRLTGADLVDEPFVVREEGSGTRAVLDDALRVAGLAADGQRIALELATNEALVNAVEGGLGIAGVSRWAADKAIALGTVVELDVAGFPVARPFYLVLPKGARTRAAEAFAELLRARLG
jgi:DNA-binding transcriptional LysR family regulator